MGYYIKCPYYLFDKEASISCEGCVRYFGSAEEKTHRIKTYCEPGSGCEFAAELDKLYERMDHMEEKEATIEKLEYENKCKAAEITKLKKEIANLKNKLDIEKKSVEREKYIAGARERIAKKAGEELFVATEKIRGLENFVGYLCKKFKVSVFNLAEVQEFGKKYNTYWKVPDMEDDKVEVTFKEKRDENRNKRDS